MVPPSITNSVPVMEEALSDATKATSSATSSGRLGRPSGIPPSISISFWRADAKSLLSLSAILSIIRVAASVSMKTGGHSDNADSLRADFIGQCLAVVGKGGFGGGIGKGRVVERQRSLNGRDVNDNTRAALNH